MTDLVVKRTLVKSQPELWNEVSDLERLARHLGELGEISISRLEPESTVAWEGEHTRGTVEIEASGWGTRVTLTAELEDALTPAPAPDPLESETAPTEPEPADPDPPAAGDESAAGEVDATDAVAEIEGAEAEADLAAPEQGASHPSDSEATDPETPEYEQTARPRRAGFLTRWLFRERRANPEARTLPASGSSRPAAEQGPGSLASASEPPAEPAPAAVEPDPTPEPEPLAEAAPEPGLPPDPAPERQALAEAAETADAAHSVDSERVRAVFESALDSLGAAHHRPFSRG